MSDDFQDANVDWFVEAAATTSRGPVREDNQDAIVLDGQVAQRSGTLLHMYKMRTAGTPISFAVVDGMGGYEGGAEAACIAATSISKFDLTQVGDAAEVDALFTNLSSRILQAGQAWGTPDMGAAFAMLTLDGNAFAVANVGDCRVYRFDPVEHVLGMLSVDDRLVGGRGGITQSLGVVSAKIDAHSYSDCVQGADRFLLCCDGVWGTLGDDLLEAIVRDNERAVDAVRVIMQQCYAQGATDNCSAIVANMVCRERGVAK